MKDKILWEVLESLRGDFPFPSVATFELALKLVVWAKLSGDQAASPAQPERLCEALAEAGYDQALLRQAFPDDSSLKRIDPAKLKSALNLLSRLREKGVLDAFDPVEAVTSMFADQAGTLALPAEVATLLVGLTGKGSEESIYAPWDFNGQLAHLCARGGAAVYLETPQISAIPALVSLLSDRPFKIDFTDPIRDPSAVDAGKLRRFDVAVAFPPLGVRYDPKKIERDLFERFPERTSSSAILSVRHLLAQARRRVVVAVQNNLLFSVGAEQAMRQDLLENGHVEAVVAMPSGLLATTNIAFAVLVLDPAGGHQQVRFVNADSPRFRASVSKAKTRLTDPKALVDEIRATDESGESATVSVRNILANDAQLQVDRYVLPESKKRLQALLADVETIPLGELVATVRPMKTTPAEDDSFEAREVGAADLPAHGYIGTPSRVVRVPSDLPPKTKQQFLRSHDIVLIVKGSVGKVGVVPPAVPKGGEGAWVAGGSAIVLRLSDSERLDPRALFMLLRSPVGQALLGSIVSGATIPLIQLKQLARLQLPVSDAEAVRRSIDVFEHEIELQHQILRLQDQQTELSADLWALA